MIKNNKLTHYYWANTYYFLFNNINILDDTTTYRIKMNTYAYDMNEIMAEEFTYMYSIIYKNLFVTNGYYQISGVQFGYIVFNMFNNLNSDKVVYFDKQEFLRKERENDRSKN